LKDIEEELDLHHEFMGPSLGYEGRMQVHSSHSQGSSTHAKTYTMGPEFSAIAATAVDIAIWTII
jgi:hypothetical protein